MVKKGQVAPEFTLPNTNTQPVSLSHYRGKKVLILFFPLAFTNVCTIELCHTRDHITDFENLDTEILAISVDSPFTLKKFKEENSLNFTLLSDFNKSVSYKYDSLYDTFVLGLKGVSKRSAFVIDEKGIIQYTEVLENAGEIPNFDKINKIIQDS